VAFEGPIAVPFAFQAVQLVFEESQGFLTTEQLPAGDAAARALRGAAPSHQFLTVQGAFARMTQ
jgi:hypothetical protein